MLLYDRCLGSESRAGGGGSDCFFFFEKNLFDELIMKQNIDLMSASDALTKIQGYQARLIDLEVQLCEADEPATQAL